MKDQNKVIDKTATYERAYLLSKGLKRSEISVALGISSGSLSDILSTANAAENGDIDALAERYKRSKVLTEWAVNRFGVSLKDVIARAGKPEPKAEEKPDPKPDDNTATAMICVLKKLDEITSALSRICGALTNLQNAEQEQHRMLATVIDNNATIIQQEITRHKDILDGIKCNTRPRKGQ